MRRAVLRRAICAGVAAFLCCGAAQAQSGAASGAAAGQGADAKALFEQGLQQFAQGSYIDALASFRRSYDIRPKPVVLYNIGNCLKALKDYLGAIQTFQGYLKLKDPSIKDEDRIDVAHLIEEMQGELGRIRVRCALKGVHLLLDGLEAGVTPLAEPIPATPGTHSLVAQSATGKPFSQSILVRKGVELEVDLAPVCAQSIAENPFSEKLVVAPPAAPVQPAPAAKPTAPPAKPAPPPQPEEQPKPLSAAGVSTWVLGSAAFAALIPALMLGRKAMTLYDDWKSDPTDQNQGDVETYMWAANGCYIASGALALGTLVAGIVWAAQKDETPAPAKTASLHVAPGAGDIVIDVRF